MARQRDALLFAFLAVAWGGTFVAIEVGLTALPPVLFAAVRFDLGALLLGAYAFARCDRWRLRTRDDALATLATGVLIIGGGSVFLFLGQQYTTGGVAAVIYSLIPVLTAGLAHVLLPAERLAPRGLAGVGLGLVGAALVVDPEAGALLDASVMGELLVALAAASIALGSVGLRRTDPRAATPAITAAGMVVGAAAMHALAFARGETLPTPAAVPADALLALAYLVVVATAGAYTVYFWLLDRVGPVQINLVSYTEPAVASAGGWLLLGETLPESAVAGFLLIVAGFALVKRRALARLLA